MRHRELYKTGRTATAKRRPVGRPLRAGPADSTGSALVTRVLEAETALAAEAPAAEPVSDGAVDAAAPPASTVNLKQRKPWTGGRVARWTIGVAGIVLLVGVGTLLVLFARMQTRIYVPLPPTPTPEAMIVALPTSTSRDAGDVEHVLSTPTPDRLKDLPAGRFNILVLGTDKRPNDPDHFARSDTLLLVNVDTISHTLRLMSIPRDLVVDIPGYGRNKVNAAYLFGEYYNEPGGGQALSLRTVSAFFDVPVDYYLTVNFDGFRKVIDTVGGVNIDVPYAIDDLNYPSDDEGDPFGTIALHFDEGWQHMDGKTALRYARTRHADNDFARSKRQMQILLALREKSTNLDLLPQVPALMDELGGMIETNVPFDQQLALLQLGAVLKPGAVITSSIDGTMISAVTLPDGSEGLKLDWQAAGPMVDAFFGVVDSAAGGNAELPQQPTTRAHTGVQSVPPRATASPKAARTPSPQRTATTKPKR